MPLDERFESKASVLALAPPSVSVVIVNWNYGRFIREAILSVRGQTYRNYECIIVDNGSTDDSVEVILDEIRGQRNFSLHKLAENIGQLGGALFALDHVHGEFVAFVDADDVLFPRFLECHVQVHIGAENPTAFTSSSCFEINAQGEVLTAGNWPLLRAWKKAEPTLRAADNTARLESFDRSAYSVLAERTRYVSSAQRGWGWNPGSANVYRTAMLERVRPKLSGQAVFGGVDTYFCLMLHAITGTNLIDWPLFVYRIHGSNDFAELPCLVDVQPGVLRRADGVAVLKLVTLIDRFDELAKIVSISRFWSILDGAVHADRASALFANGEVHDALIRQYPRLIKVFGEGRVIRELLARMKAEQGLDIVWRGRKRGTYVAAAWRVAAVNFRRKLRKIFKRS